MSEKMGRALQTLIIDIDQLISFYAQNRVGVKTVTLSPQQFSRVDAFVRGAERERGRTPFTRLEKSAFEYKGFRLVSQ
jgi:hypothetical protein